MRISDWSSDVCSSDLRCSGGQPCHTSAGQSATDPIPFIWKILRPSGRPPWLCPWSSIADRPLPGKTGELADLGGGAGHWHRRSEEHTSELQSLMRISYAVFCLKKKKTHQ